MRMMFLPVVHCQDAYGRGRCNAALVPPVTVCTRCAALRVERGEISTGKRASRRDVVEHKRQSLRKRLGLLA